MMVPFAAIVDPDVPDVLQTRSWFNTMAAFMLPIHVNTVPDHDVPSGIPFLPEGYYRGGPDGRTDVRLANLFQDVYPNDEVYLFCSTDRLRS